jgi:hypothetical protein
MFAKVLDIFLPIGYNLALCAHFQKTALYVVCFPAGASVIR